MSLSTDFLRNPWSKLFLWSFRTFRGLLFPKKTGQELFLAVSYSKPALDHCIDEKEIVVHWAWNYWSVPITHTDAKLRAIAYRVSSVLCRFGCRYSWNFLGLTLRPSAVRHGAQRIADVCMYAGCSMTTLLEHSAGKLKQLNVDFRPEKLCNKKHKKNCYCFLSMPGDLNEGLKISLIIPEMMVKNRPYFVNSYPSPTKTLFDGHPIWLYQTFQQKSVFCAGCASLCSSVEVMLVSCRGQTVLRCRKLVGYHLSPMGALMSNKPIQLSLNT